MPHQNHTFHTQSHTRNTMHNIRPIDLYACGTILKNTVNVARKSMQSTNCHTMCTSTLSLSSGWHHWWRIRVCLPSDEDQPRSMDLEAEHGFDKLITRTCAKKMVNEAQSKMENVKPKPKLVNYLKNKENELSWKKYKNK